MVHSPLLTSMNLLRNDMIVMKSYVKGTRSIDLIYNETKIHYLIKDNESSDYNNVVFLNKELANETFNELMEVKNDIAL